MNHRAILFTLFLVAAPVGAQQAIGVDVFDSRDSEHSGSLRTGVNFDLRHVDIEHYQGLRLERARFSPLGNRAQSSDRVYYRFAGGSDWKWNGQLGSDGRTWLGSASVFKDAANRQEYFLERDVVESPRELAAHHTYTFVGAAYDLPFDERDVATAMVGAQHFSDGNTRLHLRARYVRVLKPEWGLSLQLRTRYFQSSDPHLSDYYSPRWYAEAVPTLQIRRFYRRWQFQGAVGYGRQGDADSGWRPSRLIEANVVSPRSRNDWYFKAGLLRTNTPQAVGAYSYDQFHIELMRVF